MEDLHIKQQLQMIYARICNRKRVRFWLGGAAFSFA